MSFDDFTKNADFWTDYCGLLMGVICTDENSVILQTEQCKMGHTVLGQSCIDS